MADLFHYDPLTGVREFFDYDESTGTAIIRREQDVQPYIDFAQKMRACELQDLRFKADDNYFVHYATIPPIVQVELLKRGIDINNPAQTRELLRAINRDYPYLKLTEKTHESAS